MTFGIAFSLIILPLSLIIFALTLNFILGKKDKIRYGNQDTYKEAVKKSEGGASV